MLPVSSQLIIAMGKVIASIKTAGNINSNLANLNFIVNFVLSLRLLFNHAI